MSAKLCRRCEELLRETKAGYVCRNGCEQVTARPAG